MDEHVCYVYADVATLQLRLGGGLRGNRECDEKKIYLQRMNREKSIIMQKKPRHSPASTCSTHTDTHLNITIYLDLISAVTHSETQRKNHHTPEKVGIFKEYTTIFKSLMFMA